MAGDIKDTPYANTLKVYNIHNLFSFSWKQPHGEKFIVLGDQTTHGGTVTSAWGADCPTTKYRINKKPVACVGDSVSCPIPGHNNCTIIQGADGWDGYPPHRIGGRSAAREGDLCSCGAKLVSIGQSTNWHGGQGGEQPQAAPLAATAFAATPDNAKQAGAYTAQFVIIDEKTGKPAEVELGYCIVVADNDAFVGKTAGAGKTRLVNHDQRVSTEMLIPIQLEIGV